MLVAAGLLQVRAQARPWPVIQPLRVTQRYAHLAHTGSDSPFLAFVKDVAGTAVYKIECHNGNYEDASELNFSGDLQCALFALKAGVRDSWNLLAADTGAERSSDWLNRGRMTSNQLQAPCAVIPDHGDTRRFRLQGMLVTLRFRDEAWVPNGSSRSPALDGFTLEVTVVRDTRARTPAAAPVPAADVPPSCR